MCIFSHEEMTELDKLNSYMGRRFEKYMVHPGQNVRPFLSTAHAFFSE